MLGDPPALILKKHFPRPAPEEVAAISEAPTSLVADAMEGRGALHHRIKPIDTDAFRFCGVAITCQAGPADNLAVYGAMELAQPGDVVVASTDACESAAIIGDLVLGMMKNKGIAGFVTDGLVRDLPGIRQVGLPCFALGLSPNSPFRNGPGTAGLPVTLGGCQVASGDVILGDEDGVVVVPAGRISEVANTLPDLKAAEAEVETKVRNGQQMPNWTEGFFASDRVKTLD